MKHLFYIFFLGVLLFTISAWSSQTSNTNKDRTADNVLTVHFIDVGQGDSTLIEYKGKTMLIDGGRRDAGEKVVSYLDEKGIDKLDWIVSSHPDADHVGGLIEVLNKKEVKHILDSGKEHTTNTYMEYLEAVDEKDIPFDIAEVGDFIDFASGVEIQILNALRESEERNESSIVLKVSHGETDFMLAADATKENEKKMIELFNVEAEILKVGHHGSKTSTSQEFLEAVKPRSAILSYGENDYGHPTAGVVSRLRSTGADLYSIHQSGDIVVTATPESHDVHARKWSEGKGAEETKQ